MMDTGPPWPPPGHWQFRSAERRTSSLGTSARFMAKGTDAEPGVMTAEPLLHSLVLLRSWSPGAV